MAQEKGRGAPEPDPTARSQPFFGTLLRRLTLSPAARAMRSLEGAHLIQGLFEGSIIGSDLAYPGADDGGLVYEHAESGQWLGYDFRRPGERAGNQPRGLFHPLTHGKLFAALLGEVIAHDPEERTPDELLDLSSVDHASRFVVTNEEKLVDNGMLSVMTYEAAYAQVGAYEQHAEDLDRRSLSNELVHTVTPKGHTLVFVLGAETVPGIQPLTTREIERHLDNGMRPA